MAVYKFSLNEQYSKKLEKLAEEDGITVQDYIRKKLFDIENIFTPKEAVERALKKYKKGETFTIPKLYGDEWELPRGVAGVFGRRFFNYVKDECQGIIEFDKMVDHDRHAQYKVL